MYKIFASVVIFFSLSVFAVDHFKVLSLADLDSMIAKKQKNIYLFDANVDSVRAEVGIIPGAKLIDSSDAYDLKKDLPNDLNSYLVFYCANKLCTASHQAAEKAIGLGYKNVHVMVDGIFGWQKAGKKLEHIKSTANAKQPSIQEAREVTPIEANSIVLKKQAIIVDVREASERQNVIDGALWFPKSKAGNSSDWQKFVAELPKDKKIIFHCAAGFRSKELAKKLSAEGHDSAYFQGPDQWSKAGLPLKAGPAQ